MRFWLRKLPWFCPMFIILLACQTLGQVFKLTCQIRFLFQHWTRKHVQNFWVIPSIFGKNFIETFSETGLKPSLVSKSQKFGWAPQSTAAKPDVWADPNFGSGWASRVQIRVKSGRVGLKKGFKFGCNPIMYLINPNDTDLNPILGRVGPLGSKFRSSRVGLFNWVKQFGSFRIGVGWLGPFGCTTQKPSKN